MGKKTNIIKFLVFFAVFSGCFFVFGGGAHAATFVVDSTSDSGDSSAGDSSCDDGGGDCTLRAAIEETNALAGADVINFSIPGAGVHTFTPGSAYPTITEQVTIDGSTQPGASCGTLVPTTLPATNTPHTLLIEIDGTSGSPINSGLLTLSGVSASSSIVRGLVVNRAVSFSYGIRVTDATDTTIECNYVGTDADGTSPLGNANSGVRIDTSADGALIQNNLLSGNSGHGLDIESVSSATAQNNLVGFDSSGIPGMGNGGRGISVTQSSNSEITHNVVGNNGDGVYFSLSNNSTITGNFIGLNIEGDQAGNNGDGLAIFGSNSFTVGGTASTERNFISSNTGSGLHIFNNCNGTGQSIGSSVFGNYIGTTTSGTVSASFGNGGSGVEVNEYNGSCASVYNHQIGGDDTGESNVIAGNTEDGIRVHQGAPQNVFSIAFFNNSIFSNGNLGINLAADSDQDSGIADTDLDPNPINNFLMSYPATNANYYINHPTINSMTTAGNQVTLNYSYQANGVEDNSPFILSSDLVGYRLDFYINDGAQDGAYTGYAQGKTHLGSFIVDGSETNATHVFTSPVTLTGSQNITATATVLWEILPDTGTCGERIGNGPPYSINTSGCPM